MPDSWEKIERDEKLLLGFILAIPLAMLIGGLLVGAFWLGQVVVSWFFEVL